MNGIKICGTGHSVPAKLVTNEDMARIVDTDDEWITSRTGIKTRHHCTTETHADLCLGAAKQALESAGITPDQIGACIIATCTAETVVPSAACILQRDLQLPMDIPCFDLSAACTGFLFSLHTMECLLRVAPRPYGLVIGCEVLTRVTNWEDRSTCILFGDGAGAVVVKYDPTYPSICAELGTHGDEQMLKIPGVEAGVPSKLSMEGRKVFQFAVKAVPYCIDKVLEKSGKTMEDVDFFVFHQANGRIIDNVVKKYHIPPEKYYKNISEYGNTSSASIPIVISELFHLGKIGSGSRILCVGFGGGLTWGGALIELE